ncbi:MAG: hypothetical protein LBI42_10025 [Chitinispirillales bacterium]|jgi:hypothetical protein|nr:hypothetical protein [Chitinispirillales bacterium]
MTQKLLSRFSIKHSLLLIFAATVLISLSLSSLSCSKNPADPDDIHDNDSTEIPEGFIPISSFEELCKIGKDPKYPLDSSYILIRDIDASPSRSMNSRKGFEPIGMKNKFTGVFDGAGHSIRNLYINWPDSATVGMFGYIYDAQISRLHIAADTVRGKEDVGGIVGCAERSFIDSCSFTGIVTGRKWVGGIAGIAEASKITRCISGGIVFSDTVFGGSAGGLIGMIDNQTIVAFSYSDASVIGNHNAGGLVGYSHNESAIRQSYSTGSVNGGKGYTGGLLGFVFRGIVEECYSTGEVIWNPPGQAGGLIGRADTSGSTKNNSVIDRCYWDISSSGISNSGGGAAKDTTILVARDTTITAGGVTIDTTVSVSIDTTLYTGEQGRESKFMKIRQTYEGWDFDNVWRIDSAKTTPYFRWHNNPFK